MLPLDDRAAERMNPAIAGRPTLVVGNVAAALPGHDPPRRERRASTSRTARTQVTAEIDVPEDGADGAIVAQGGRTGGWGLLADRGQAGLPLQLLRPAATTVTSDAAAARPGTHQVRAEFAYDGGGIGRGGDVTLYVDGDRGRERARRAHAPAVLLLRRGPRRRDGHAACPCTRATPRRRAASPARSPGRQIDLGDDDHNHLIDPEDHLAAMIDEPARWCHRGRRTPNRSPSQSGHRPDDDRPADRPAAADRDLPARHGRALVHHGDATGGTHARLDRQHRGRSRVVIHLKRGGVRGPTSDARVVTDPDQRGPMHRGGRQAVGPHRRRDHAPAQPALLLLDVDGRHPRRRRTDEPSGAARATLRRPPQAGPA